MSSNNTASASVAISSTTTELDTLDGRLVRLNEIASEIVQTLAIPYPGEDGAVPTEPRVTELDGRIGRIRDQVRSVQSAIDKLELIA
jgi:hypothetical protein